MRIVRQFAISQQVAIASQQVAVASLLQQLDELTRDETSENEETSEPVVQDDTVEQGGNEKVGTQYSSDVTLISKGFFQVNRVESTRSMTTEDISRDQGGEAEQAPSSNNSSNHSDASLLSTRFGDTSPKGVADVKVYQPLRAASTRSLMTMAEKEDAKR